MSSRSGSIAVFTRSMRSGHCWGSAGRRWLRRMTGCTPVHGNIQNAAAKARRASSELRYRQTVTKSGALGRQPDKHESMELDQEKRKQLVWDIDKKLQEDEARPIIYHLRSGTC